MSALAHRVALFAAATVGGLMGLIYMLVICAFVFLGLTCILARLVFELPALIWNSAAKGRQ